MQVKHQVINFKCIIIHVIMNRVIMIGKIFNEVTLDNKLSGLRLLKFIFQKPIDS